MPAIEPFQWLTTEKPWGQEILIGHWPGGWLAREGEHFGGYAGKILQRFGGDEYHRAGLQWHTSRDELFALLEGEVLLYFVDQDGVLRVTEMHPGQSFHVPIGARHSVLTLTDSVMFEVSCGPVTSGDAVNVEADYRIEGAVAWP